MANDEFFEALWGSRYGLPTFFRGDGLLIDFAIAFVFFTALSFAVLHRRFEHKRSAAVMSAALGTALAIGLAAWELRSGLRLADLGPIAAGLGMIMIALVIYHAIKRVGGTWSGGLTALGCTLLIGQVLGVPGLQQVVNGVLGPLLAISLIAGGVSLVMMKHSSEFKADVPVQNPRAWPIQQAPRLRPEAQAMQAQAEPSAQVVEERVHAIDDMKRLSQRFDEHLELAEHNARELPAQPQLAALLRRQLAALLPESQVITQRLADLRAKTQMLRMGHLAKIRRLAPQVPKLPPEAARVASMQLREAYREARLEERIERLDQAAVHAEKQIADVVAKVKQLLDAGRYAQAADVLHNSEKLARQVTRLMKQIEKDEQKVLALAVQATRRYNPGKQAA